MAQPRDYRAYAWQKIEELRTVDAANTSLRVVRRRNQRDLEIAKATTLLTEHLGYFDIRVRHGEVSVADRRALAGQLVEAVLGLVKTPE